MKSPKFVLKLIRTAQLATAVFVFLASTVNAQSIFTNPITGTNPNTANPYTTGQTVDSNLGVTGIGRGTGISGNAGDNRYNATSWNTTALDANEYFTFTLTPNSGFQLNLVSFVYVAQASGTGPTSFSFRSSTDSFGSSIDTPTSTGATISLSSGSFQSLTGSTEFRLYAWGGTGGTFSVNSFTFNGSLSAIPEPSTYAAIFGALALAGTVWHRRRQRKAV